MIRTGYDSDGSGDGRGGRAGGAGSKKTLSVQEQMVRLLFVAYCSWLLRGRFVISVVDLRVRQNCRRLLSVASGWFYSSGGVSLQNIDRRVLCLCALWYCGASIKASVLGCQRRFYSDLLSSRPLSITLPFTAGGPGRVDGDRRLPSGRTHRLSVHPAAPHRDGDEVAQRTLPQDGAGG
jgi:hypothetical protein